jgi:hypothetical protein
MSAMTKIILGLEALLLVCVVAGTTMTQFQRGNEKEIQALRQQVGEAKATAAMWETKSKEEAARGQEWRQTADTALARMGALEGRLKGVEAKLAAMGTQAPVTPTEGLPREAQAIAQAMTKAGVPAQAIQPPVGELAVGLSAPSAQKGLGLIIDGTNYPSALSRIEVLTEEGAILAQQKADAIAAEAARREEATQFEAALHAEEQAKAACETGSAAKDKLVDEANAMLKAERPKKWFWGIGGAALTALVFLL